MVWRMVSKTQPRTTFLVVQLPSPVRSFLREMASLRWTSLPGWARTQLTSSSRWRRSLRMRLGPPWPTWI
jgi:hypothetical protein